MWGVGAVCVGDRAASRSKQTRWRSPASACDSHRTRDSCAQWHRAPGPPWRETFHSRLALSYKYGRDGAQRVASVYA